MPASLAKNVLVGLDGSAWLKPAGTTYALLDKTDFPLPVSPATTSLLNVPAGHDFRINDPVLFSVMGTATLRSPLVAATTYYVVTVNPTSIAVSATLGGTAIAFTGSGSDASGFPINGIKITYADFAAMCQVTNWSFNVTRTELDTTSLPCGPLGGDGSQAPFRTGQAGYADGSGSMEVRFYTDQSGLARRLLQNSLRRRQEGAEVRLFIDTVYSNGSVVDTQASTFIQGPISILGFDLGIATEEATTATVNFKLSDQPTRIL